MSNDERLPIFIGRDKREPLSYEVTARSLLAHSSKKLLVIPLSMSELQRHGLYTRPTGTRDGRLFDFISNLPMSTEFALTRFWVPYLCEYKGWALFVDGDWLFRDDVAKLFAYADPRYAVMVVKHFHERAETRKMDDQVQKQYPRKLWSALMLFNCGHRACRTLELDYLNHSHRHELHGFSWCHDDEIGELPMNWHVVDMDVAGYHLTRGTPELGVWGSQFDDEWMAYLEWDEFSKIDESKR